MHGAKGMGIGTPYENASCYKKIGGGEEDGEEETGEENGRCLFYEVAKTYDIPTKWFPFRVFDFLFHFFLAPLHSSLSSPSSNRLRF